MPARKSSVRLLPLTTTERAEFLERQAADYADAKARAGFWSPEEAPVRARDEIAGLLEKGGPHELLKGVDANGTMVGWIWVGPVPGAKFENATRWLYQITVVEGLRRHGYGRALLAAIEDRLRTQGARELRLNVFSWNEVAISLYESSGYEVVARAKTNLEMRKQLA